MIIIILPPPKKNLPKLLPSLMLRADKVAKASGPVRRCEMAADHGSDKNGYCVSEWLYVKIEII